MNTRERSGEKQSYDELRSDERGYDDARDGNYNEKRTNESDMGAGGVKQKKPKQKKGFLCCASGGGDTKKVGDKGEPHNQAGNSKPLDDRRGSAGERGSAGKGSSGR